MKTVLFLLSLVLITPQAFAGGVESKPGWISVSFAEGMVLPAQQTPKPVFTDTSIFELKKNPLPANVEIKIDDTLLKARLIETMEGGVESIMADPVHFSNTDLSAQLTTLPESITSIKYVSESPEAVYIQINNSAKVLEIKDIELIKSKPLWEQVGASAKTAEWIVSN